jgi:serine/threonine protein phosphatase PrpC
MLPFVTGPVRALVVLDMVWACVSCWTLQSAHDSDRNEFETPLSDTRAFAVGLAHCRNNGIAENATSVKLSYLGEETTGFFAFFEGHRNGFDASRTASLHLHELLQAEINSHDSSTDLKDCFENAFQAMDDRLKTTAVDRGTSATTCLVRKHDDVLRLHVANVGNTRAVLCRGATAIRLTEDHNQTSEGEKARLDASKSYMRTSKRIRQLLPSSRALGDHLLKDWVISKPHYLTCELTPDDSFLILTTSKVTDVIADDDVATTTRGESMPPPVAPHSPTASRPVATDSV